MCRRRFDDKGATLIELLFSVAIMLTLTASFYQLLVSFYQGYKMQEAVAEMQQQGRVAIDLISREIAQAGYDPTGTAFQSDAPAKEVPIANASMTGCIDEKNVEPIMEASETFFHFLADLGRETGGDPDGRFVVRDSTGVVIGGDPGEDIRYEWVGASGRNSCGQRKPPYTLYRNSGGGAQEVAQNIESFDLTYFDGTGTTLPTGNLGSAERASIRKVVIKLKARTGLNDASNGGGPTRGYTSEVWLRNM